jgi:peptidoglycan/xylan/chitin deacetylase (PgdA/CDA1 family)
MEDRQDGSEGAVVRRRSAARAVGRSRGRVFTALVAAVAIVAVALVFAIASSGAGPVARQPVVPGVVETSVPGARPAVVETEPPPPPTGPTLLPAVPTRIVKSVPGAGKRVALTFDLCERDGDQAGYDEGIVGVLRGSNVRATFFMGGKWAESHPEQAASLGADPLFEIGNHSWSHLDLEKTSPEQTEEQIMKGQEALWRLTGRTPTVFRFPFGTYNAASLAAVCGHGMSAIEWNVVTGDPDKNVHADDIVRVVKKRTRDGAIIIMHANGRGWHTAEALPRIIEWLRSQGYEPVTVSELLATE